jgi:hypothetical protein
MRGVMTRTADEEIRKARDALLAAVARSRGKTRIERIEAVIRELTAILKKE